MGNQIQPKIEILNIMTTLDWSVFILILCITFASVLYGHFRKKKLISNNNDNILDLILMGRRLTLPLFISTLVATWYGGIFGVTQIAFEQGVYNFITQGFFWYLAYILFALFLVDKIAPYNAVTLPNLIKKMFGVKSSYLAAVFNFFNVLPIAYIISLGIFINSLWGIGLSESMIIGVFIVLLYSMLGGFRAVVFSDLVQFYVMCTGVFLILIFSFLHFGGLNFLIANLPDSHWSPTGKVGLGTTLVWGFIALSTLIDPNFYQRCFAAVNPKIAKKGILISTFIWFCFDICTTLGAMYAKAVIPSALSQDAYLTYAVQILPSGLRGFVLAGILATILSTLDSYLFLAGTTLSFDLAPKSLKGKPWVHHLGILFVAVIALLMAQFFDGNIKKVWKVLGTYSAACLLFPVLYGHFSPNKISDKQFIFIVSTGIIGVTIWHTVTLNAFWSNIDALYIGICCTFIGLIFANFLTFGKKEKV